VISCRSPNILRSPTSEVISKALKVRLLFEKSDALGGIDSKDDQPVFKNKSQTNQLTLTPKPTITTIDHATNYFHLSPDVDLTQENALRIAREFASITGLYEEDKIEEPKTANAYIDTIDLNTVNITMSLLKPTTPNPPDVFLIEDDEIIFTKPLDMTRIVFANMDIFTKSFPYFCQLIDSWIDAMDPILAYVVLDACPQVLTKKPAQLRPLLKYLYGQISLGQLTDSLNSGHDYRSKPRKGLHKVLNAQKVLRCRVDEVRGRVECLRRLFYEDSSTKDLIIKIETNDSTVSHPLPLIAAPKLLIEPIGRIRYRKQLLADYLSLGLIESSSSANQVKDLILHYPRLLVQPLSVVKARIPFAATIAEDGVRFSMDEVNQLMDCKTSIFLSRLQELFTHKNISHSSDYIENAYLDYLKSQMNASLDDNDNNVGLVEGKLCGLLNEKCDKESPN
jgi:hypothetical protein